MAIYVTSDAHGHLRALDSALEQAAPGTGDIVYVLGDMIDRGPDPVGVMRVCRDLKNCTVLMGNHEDLMLSFLDHPRSRVDRQNWVMNGGMTTAEGLTELEAQEFEDLISWVRDLPLWQVVRVGGRPFVLVHAGIFPYADMPSGECADEELEAMLGAQVREDLLWIREEFWGSPTGMVDGEGRGAIVVAGHTPTPYLDTMADAPDRPARGDDGLFRMVRVGACEQTRGVADRWDIDCCAAGGAGMGQLLMLRLDDGEEFYEPVREGE